MCWTLGGDEVGQCLGYTHFKKKKVKSTATGFSVKVLIRLLVNEMKNNWE